MKEKRRGKKAGVKKKPDQDVVKLVKRYLNEGKGDPEIAQLLKPKGISLWKVRHIRSKVLGIKKPGGGFGKSKAKKAKTKPRAQKRTKRRRIPVASGNGSANRLRAAVRDLDKTLSAKREARKEIGHAENAVKKAADVMKRAKARLETARKKGAEKDKAFSGQARKTREVLSSLK